MKIKIYQIDAFTDKLFGGNPAAVCPLDKWLTDDILQNIAMENNLAETAYFVRRGDEFQIRWFTPTIEVDLCGHATLASAHVLFNHLNPTIDSIVFQSNKSGPLTVSRKNGLLTLNFPVDVFEKINPFFRLTNGFNIIPSKVYKGKSDYMFVY